MHTAEKPVLTFREVAGPLLATTASIALGVAGAAVSLAVSPPAEFIQRR